MQRKMILFNMTLCFLTVVAKAQSIQPAVIGAGGTHFSAANVQLSWTAGEAVIQTISNGDNYITQGFHQPGKVTVTEIVNALPPELAAHLFPNPTTGSLTLELEGNSTALEIRLFDIAGKEISGLEVPAGQASVQIDIGKHAAGSYMLRLTSTNEECYKTYLLEKID